MRIKFASCISCGLVRVVGTVRYMKLMYCGLCWQLVNIPRKHSASLHTFIWRWYIFLIWMGPIQFAFIGGWLTIHSIVHNVLLFASVRLGVCWPFGFNSRCFGWLWMWVKVRTLPEITGGLLDSEDLGSSVTLLDWLLRLLRMTLFCNSGIMVKSVDVS